MNKKLGQKPMNVSFSTILVDELDYKNRLIKDLAAYFEASQDALFQERRGHTPLWENVQRLADKIDDEYDLSVL